MHRGNVYILPRLKQARALMPNAGPHWKRVVSRVVRWQLAVGLICAALWSPGGWDAALAALVAGTASAALSLQFAIRVFSRDPADSPSAVLQDFYRAEAFKLVLAAVFFAVAAKYFGHLFMPLLTTWVATLVVFRAALLWKPGY